MATLSRQLKEACDIAVQWVVQKLNAGDGLSCLLFVIDGPDKKTSIYIRDTFEEAIQLARNDLTSYYQDVVAYVIAYDGGWRDSSGVEHRAIFVESEERASASPRRLAYRLQCAAGQPLSFTKEVFEFRPPEWSLFTAPNESDRET